MASKKEIFSFFKMPFLFTKLRIKLKWIGGMVKKRNYYWSYKVKESKQFL